MLLVREATGWVPASLTSYPNEKALQDILASDGSLVPGCTGTAAVTEFQTPAGPVDLLYVDSNGVVTLVECKLQSNSEIRRKVVGQLIDYASALGLLTIDDFAHRFGARAGRPLEEAVRESAVDFDAATFRDLLAKNLSEGRLRLVVAIDQITEDLRRSIEYLNDHSTDDVIFLALELGYLSRDGVEILASETYGAEVETAGRGKGPTASGKARWTSEEVTQAVKEVSDTRSREFIDQMLLHAKAQAAEMKGGQGARVSAGFYYSVTPKRPSLWSIWLGDNPEFSLNIGAVSNVSEMRARRAFEALQASPAIRDVVGVTYDDVARKYPNMSFAKVQDDPEALPAVLDYLNRCVSRVTEPVSK